MSINVQAFLDSLVYMGEGMLGIFAVMLVIIAVIYALGHFYGERRELVRKFLTDFLSPVRAEKA